MNDPISSNDVPPGWTLIFVAWIVVASATLGSLFFSEVMGVPICVLCWYQRIALYPLTFILAVGLFPYDPKVVRYAGVLTGAGWLIALFHVLLVAGVIPEKIHPCVQGIPCSETHIALFGFLTIPLMSFLTFTLVAVLLFLAQRMKSS
ncbi:MAG: disulfide bond formation protein B [Magnetococcales bacterium]|nr:disulfide bond formation protein B [Magnetococcales bacterium]